MYGHPNGPNALGIVTEFSPAQGDERSMAMTQEPIDWRYLLCIRPIFKAYVMESPHKIWWYVTYKP